MRFTIFQESRKGQRKVNQDRLAYTYSRDTLLLVPKELREAAVRHHFIGAGALENFPLDDRELDFRRHRREDVAR